jgi:hypothetical protein
VYSYFDDRFTYTNSFDQYGSYSRIKQIFGEIMQATVAIPPNMGIDRDAEILQTISNLSKDGVLIFKISRSISSRENYDIIYIPLNHTMRVKIKCHMNKSIFEQIYNRPDS